MSRVRASCLLVDNCLKTETKECKRNCWWLLPCKRSCFSHLDSLWAILTLFRVQSLHVACPLSSSFPRKPPLPPSFSSFRPDPACSACCSAVQRPESSPSSLCAICSICLCPAHLASCPPGLRPTWPRTLGGGFGVAGLGLSFPAPSGAAPWWLWNEGSSYLQGTPSSMAVAFNKDENNKKQKRETQQTQAPVSQMWAGKRRGGFSSPARNTWETQSQTFPGTISGLRSRGSYLKES